MSVTTVLSERYEYPGQFSASRESQLWEYCTRYDLNGSFFNFLGRFFVLGSNRAPPLCSTASFLTMYAIQRWAVRRTLWCHDVDPPDLPLSTYLHRLDSWRAQNRTFSRKKLSELCSRYFQRTFPLVQGYRSSYSRRGNIHPVFFFQIHDICHIYLPKIPKKSAFFVDFHIDLSYFHIDLSFEENWDEPL